jgi:hypothetical protein
MTLPSCSILNFLIFEKKFILFFISVQSGLNITLTVENQFGGVSLRVVHKVRIAYTYISHCMYLAGGGRRVFYTPLIRIWGTPSMHVRPPLPHPVNRLTQKVYRVPGFLSNRPNWLPHPQASVATTLSVPKEGDAIACGRGGRGELIRTMGQTLWSLGMVYSLYGVTEPAKPKQ